MTSAAVAGVTVIVPTYNRSGYLAQALDSLLAQTVRPLQIIVVDDGSTDATPEIAAAYAGRIVYLRKANGGKATAVAAALTHAQGEWIWIFDDDDVALPDAIERRLLTAAAQPQAGFIYAPHHLGEDDAAAGVRITGTHALQEIDAAAFLLEIMRGCFFHLNSCLVRRAFYDRLGGFDAALLRGQDYDFQIRLAQVATPAFCSHPVFIFRQHSGVRGTPAVQHDAQSRGAVFKRFSVRIGTKIRSEFPLGDFLVPRMRGELDSRSCRTALFNRMQVMANHGCVTEMMADLVGALQSGGAARGEEQRALGTSINTGWALQACLADWDSFSRALDSTLAVPGGRPAIRSLAWGVARGITALPGSAAERRTRAALAARLLARSVFGRPVAPLAA